MKTENAELEPMDLGYRIVLKYLDDETQKETELVRKVADSGYQDALDLIRADYERMKAENPTDDRFGFTLLSQMTTNFFGMVSRSWHACAWFGTNDLYLIGKPEKTVEEQLHAADLALFDVMQRIATSSTRRTPFVPALPLL
jgi:hypothetical protein